MFLIGRNFDKLEKIRNEIENSKNFYQVLGFTLIFAYFLIVNDLVKVVIIISEASDSTLKNFENVFSEIERTLKEFKGILRIFINNVGIGQGGKRRLGDIPIDGDDGEDIFEDIVSVNCSYSLLLTAALLKHLREKVEVYNGLPRGYDRVALFNLASCAALTPATPFSSLYAATKAFNRSFSISLSGELAAKRLLHPESIPIVDVICVNPGFVVSNMTKMSESLYCCTAEEHATVVFRKLSKSSQGMIADIVPHWKHGLIWSFMWMVEFIIPWEWLLVGFIMPAMLKFSGKYRNFKIE